MGRSDVHDRAAGHVGAALDVLAGLRGTGRERVALGTCKREIEIGGRVGQRLTAAVPSTLREVARRINGVDGATDAREHLVAALRELESEEILWASRI